MLWSENAGTVEQIGQEAYYVPNGFEVGTDPADSAGSLLANQFLILSDDNREPIQFKNQRIEKRERMINGRMRSYHIADKLNISTSWNMLPSRSFAGNPNFDSTTGVASLANISSNNLQFTTDGGAGGVDILSWYENHKGSFWVFLAYDKHSNMGGYNKLNRYNQVIEMYISDFSYTVNKRGGTNFDFWDISVSLEEV
jgi:hypothetical protein